MSASRAWGGLLVVAIALVPAVGGMPGGGVGRELALMGLVAVIFGAFVAFISSSQDMRGDLPGATGTEAARGVALTFVTALAVATALIALIFWVRDDPSPLLGQPGLKERLTQHYAVAFFAGAVGLGELIARYRDDPSRLLGLAPTSIYVGVNIAAGLFALVLVQQFRVVGDGTVAALGTPRAGDRAIIETLVAAFGAVAFFRTSLFTARIGNTDVPIGPATVLKSFLDSCDRLVNRTQAIRRASHVAGIMGQVDFAKAKAALPALCFTLVEAVDTDTQLALGDQIRKLDEDASIPPEAKAQLLGARLLREVGPEVLRRAIGTLGDAIKR